jgi:non-heme chloroperoxidase
MPYCEVAPDVRLYYEDFGEGPPIVLICGANLTHKSWESQVAALAPEFRTVAFDWRGSGASDRPRSGYSGETATADLCTLMERLALPPAVLVGHGLGVHLALMAAETRPQAVRGLVLASASPWFSGERDGQPGGVPDEFLRFMVSQLDPDGVLKVPYAESCFEMGDKWLFHHRQSPGVYQAIMEQALDWPQHVLNSYAKSMRGVDHRARAPSIRCPTVVVQGRHDRKQRYEGGVHLARLIPNARLVTLENSATMGNIEEVPVFNQTVVDFVRALAPTRRAA